MKVLLCHNFYKESGGEDLVFYNEKKLLERNGNAVSIYIEKNNTINNLINKINTFINSAYSRKTKLKFERFINLENPDIVHVHNFFPLITPSIYDVCRKHNIPVIQTLHNYRIICSAATLLKNGKTCEICIKNSPYQSVRYKCYQQSYIGSFALARMINTHKKSGTWNKKLNSIITLTDFGRNKFIESGINPSKLIVKPNFIEDPKIEKKPTGAHTVLFVGRISDEKGIDFLISTWRSNESLPELRIIGDGPLYKKHSEEVSHNITFLGKKEKNVIYKEMSDASCLVFPSIWYEGFPMVILEAFAIGLPVIASNFGSMSSIIKNGYNGLHFEPSNRADLINKVFSIINNSQLESELSKNARVDYEQFYTPEKNYEMLMDIYKRAINECQ
ncbi:MAG: glycosyltransferase family 4 protein [Aequorivita sp.]|nr:glycosyltransferase family 4 protein [Aequorivita sp.]